MNQKQIRWIAPMAIALLDVVLARGPYFWMAVGMSALIGFCILLDWYWGWQ